ncbi:hypothetical protein C1708_20500 [Streptomyces sp. DH-12]|uniref:hypothetical protein n=1 Tax=Streptomyces sp. DH-12 TaxID=2072509 RepID=UPI000CCFB112|nr:hypothetical protein [Streptomyces sp. DH-12]PNV34409.1 hypothetical protein C1708_20500 [Streptomyces sp. DH-12]
MAARSSSRPPFAWTKKDFHDDVPPGRRQLAMALREVCRHLVIKSPDGNTILTHPTQAQAAKHLYVGESSLTRYLTGQYVPSKKVTTSIFETACRDAGGEQGLGVTKEHLLELRARAEQERCSNCARHREEAQAARHELEASLEERKKLTKEAGDRDAELRALRKQYSALKQETLRIHLATEAGQQNRHPEELGATPLPVPPRNGDRQRSIKDVSAAQRIRRRAEELAGGGRPDRVLALLRHTAEACTSQEMALLVALLRSNGQEELAGNFVHIYGRDRSDRDVLRAALVLHEHDVAADAEALLRVAAARP